MTAGDNMIIWYVDEEADDRFTYQMQLVNVTQNKIAINAIEPLADISQMAEQLLSDKSTVAVIIDLRLSEAGSVNYSGLELARIIRGRNDKLPLYILTNHAKDVTATEWEIEYVFSKDGFTDEKEALAIGERIKRHVNIYFEIADSRMQRFMDLLRKSINQPLSEAEINELQKLEYFRSASVINSEAVFASELASKLDEQEALLAEIRAKLKKS